MPPSNWPPPPVKPVFDPKSSPPDPKATEPAKDFDKAADDTLKPKLSAPIPTLSPDGAIENRGTSRPSVAEKDVDPSKLPDTRTGNDLPRKEQFNAPLGRHRQSSPSKTQERKP